MAKANYQYTTSPRKLQPEEEKNKKTKKQKLEVVKDLPNQSRKVAKEEKKRRMEVTIVIIALFITLVIVGYRNSKINEEFTEVQSLKKELSSLEKENEQLKVGIENSLNLNYIEQVAKEKLGMQKLTNKQSVYVNLPKKDYVEAASEKVVIEEKNFFEQLWNSIFNK